MNLVNPQPALPSVKRKRDGFCFVVQLSLYISPAVGPGLLHRHLVDCHDCHQAVRVIYRQNWAYACAIRDNQLDFEEEINVSTFAVSLQTLSSVSNSRDLGRRGVYPVPVKVIKGISYYATLGLKWLVSVAGWTFPATTWFQATSARHQVGRYS